MEIKNLPGPKEKEDEFTCFGKVISCQLAKMKPILAIEAMVAVQQVMSNFAIKSIQEDEYANNRFYAEEEPTLKRKEARKTFS